MIEIYLWVVMASFVIMFIFGLTAARILEQGTILLFGGHYREALKYFAASLFYICICSAAFMFSLARRFFE